MSKQRVEYIDALRGFTMLIVVMGHIEIYGFQLLDTPMLRVISTFHVPLFFFISGMLAYRLSLQWQGEVVHLLSQKVRQLLIPTLLIGLLFAMFHERVSVQTFLTHPYKMGYWFTIALFQMFVLLYTINQLCWTIHKQKKVVSRTWMVLLIGASALLYIAKVPVMRDPVLFDIANAGSWHCLFLYFQFFAFGLLFVHYKSFFTQIMDNGYMLGLCIVLFVMLVYGRYALIGIRETTVVDIWKLAGTFIDTCSGYLGIVVVHRLFYRYQTHLTSSSKLGRCLQLIGQGTLGIYLLHWFFLPNLSVLGVFLKDASNIILEVPIVLILSILVIASCVLCDKLLRSSDWLNYLLGGNNHGNNE